MPECRCDCGRSTGARFCPGHDATLKSRLIRQYRTNPDSSASQLDARARLEAEGWLYMIDPSVPRPVRVVPRAKSRVEAPGPKAKSPKMTKPTPAREERRAAAKTARQFRPKSALLAAEDTSELARARSLFRQMERSKANVLSELANFGQSLCSLCSHDRDSHQAEAGRNVCLECFDDRLRAHSFRSLLDEAKSFFSENPTPVPASFDSIP
jgi:hypothetical protein